MNIEQFFGPLPQEYCVYFYALSVVFGGMFAISVISIGFFMVTNMKKVNAMFCVNSFFVLLNLFFAYLVNRLLNTMCVRSV